MKSLMRKLMILATITTSLGLASLSQADVISINFQGGRSPTTGPDVTDITGYIQVDNWNNITGVSGTVANLNDDSGNNSGASVTWETHNLWDDLKHDGTTFDDHDGLYGAATGYGGAEQYWGGG